MNIRRAEQKDLPELLDIYNYEVENGVATFDMIPKTLEERQIWLEQHNIANHPLYVAELDGVVTGYVSLSTYRDKEAFQATVELSVYIAPDYRGQGIAGKLLDFIIKKAKADDSIHTIVSVITSGNAASCRLHDKFGFQYCGTMPSVGIKFGRELGIDNYVLIV